MVRPRQYGSSCVTDAPPTLNKPPKTPPTPETSYKEDGQQRQAILEKLEGKKRVFQDSISLLGADKILQEEQRKRLPSVITKVAPFLESYLSRRPAKAALLMTRDDLRFLTQSVADSPPSPNTLKAFQLLYRAHRKGNYPLPGQLVRSWMHHRLSLAQEPQVSTQVVALLPDEIAKDQVKMWRFLYDARREIKKEECDTGSLIPMMEYMAYRSNFKALFILLHSMTRVTWTEDADERLATFLTGVRSEAMIIRWIQRAVALWETSLENLAWSERTGKDFRDLLYMERSPLEKAVNWWGRLIELRQSIHPYEGRALARRLKQERLFWKAEMILQSSRFVLPSTTFITEQRWIQDLAEAIQVRSSEQVEKLMKQAVNEGIFLHEYAFCTLLRHLPSSSFDFIDSLLTASCTPIEGVAIWDVRAHEYGLRGDREGLRRVLKASLDGTFIPDARAYTTLIKAFSRQGMVNEIRQCIEGCYQHGIVFTESLRKAIDQAVPSSLWH